MARHAKSSVDQAEVERFAHHAGDWWDARGPMAALHKLNPVRIGYIRDKACEQFARDQNKLDCLRGLRILDIGLPRRKTSPRRASVLTLCWRWKWSSMLWMSEPSLPPAP